MTSGRLIPSQKSGLTCPLLNKFLKVKFEEEDERESRLFQQTLEDDSDSSEEAPFSKFLDTILTKRDEKAMDLSSRTQLVV